MKCYFKYYIQLILIYLWIEQHLTESYSIGLNQEVLQLLGNLNIPESYILGSLEDTITCQLVAKDSDGIRIELPPGTVEVITGLRMNTKWETALDETQKSSESVFILPRVVLTRIGNVTPFLDLECRLRKSPEMSSTPPIVSEVPSLSTLHIALIVLAATVFLGLDIALIAYCIKRHKSKAMESVQGMPKSKPLSTEIRQISITEAPKGSLKSTLGVAVYIDPSEEENIYDNKDKNSQKPTSGDYSYPYMDLAADAKAKQGMKGGEMVNEQSGERPYDDVTVENAYSYTYSTVMK